MNQEIYTAAVDEDEGIYDLGSKHLMVTVFQTTSRTLISMSKHGFANNESFSSLVSCFW